MAIQEAGSVCFKAGPLPLQGALRAANIGKMLVTRVHLKRFATVFFLTPRFISEESRPFPFFNKMSLYFFKFTKVCKTRHKFYVPIQNFREFNI